VKVLEISRENVLPKCVASVISKTIKGNTYYYLATSARVEGKPRIVEHTYLGTAAEIGQALAGSPRMPTRS